MDYFIISSRKKEYQDFIDIFHNSEEYGNLVAVLRDVEPPILNADNMYSLAYGNKSALAAYTDVLLKRKKIKNVSYRVLAELISRLVGEEIGYKTFSMTDTEAYKEYHPQFLSRIV